MDQKSKAHAAPRNLCAVVASASATVRNKRIRKRFIALAKCKESASLIERRGVMCRRGLHEKIKVAKRRRASTRTRAVNRWIQTAIDSASYS